MRPVFAVIVIALVACTGPKTAASSSNTPAAHPQLLAWTYEGVVRQNSIDNRSVILPGGGYRQVFSRWGSLTPGPDGLPGQDPYYATAVSSDGIHWTEEGKSPIGYYIPFRLPDATYRAVVLNPAPAKLYTSTDAKNWSVVGTIGPPELGNPKCGTTSGMFSDVVALPDGTLRAYYTCEVGTFFNIKATEIRSATSKDGLNWQKDLGVRINPLDGPEIPRGPGGQVTGAGGADHPRVFRLPDGTLKMFYNSLNLCCLWSATSGDGLIWTNRKPENVFGGDADVIVLSDGRLRVSVSGNLGLPSDFAGHSAGENWSRTVSYIYGPTNYRLATSGQLLITPGEVGPAHLTVVVEGSGRSVTLDAAAYAGIGGTELHDLRNGAYEPVTVNFKPPFDKPPFTADATFAWTVDPLEESRILGGGTLIFADDGLTKQIVPIRFGWTNAGPGCPPPCGPANCGPGTSTPCPPTNCGPGTGKLCAPPSAPPCQLGQPIGPQGCLVPGQYAPDGTPIYCSPKSQAGPIYPDACKPYY